MKKDFPFNFDVDLMTRKDFDKIVSDLSNVISSSLDPNFVLDVRKFLDENFSLSSFVKDGICDFFYLALSHAYDLGGLTACHIIHRKLFDEGDLKK